MELYCQPFTSWHVESVSTTAFLSYYKMTADYFGSLVQARYSFFIDSPWYWSSAYTSMSQENTVADKAETLVLAYWVGSLVEFSMRMGVGGSNHGCLEGWEDGEAPSGVSLELMLLGR